MNRDEYINKLRINLQGLPNSEIQDILSDYEEHFQIGISKGKSEEEISKELGDPKEVAKGYRATNKTSERVNEGSNYTSNTNDSTRKFLISLLLIGVNLIVLFGPVMAVFGIMMGIFGMGIGFTFGGIGLIFRLPFGFFITNAYPHILTSLGMGIGLSSLGILTLILAVFLIKLLFKLASRYIKWNIELINK